MQKGQVAKRFNRSAVTYDQYALVQKEMARRLLFTLQTLDLKAEKILELGCGTGYFTRLLLDHYPASEVTAVDLAEKMVETARQKTEPSDRVRFFVGDAENLDRSSLGTFDLIVSNAMIQWLARPSEALSGWASLLKPNGWLVASTFGPDTFQELRSLFQRVEEEMGLEPKPHVISMRTPGEWQRLFHESAYREVDYLEYRHRAEYRDCRDFLKSVKATGASYNEAELNLLTSSRVLLRVMDAYNRIYRSGSGVSATYHLVEIRGRKRAE
ncbi:malonyl-ACP O-methyltransferase BioC [Lihuaxuella thermophila]|uniref:Malonyl-[acyl-carrier protein] O-methyltransferase n=1 Tax=Lihuaxuella thermophila TaxID=1173111 RepID=A0A1H8CCG1_9BACL|nr:malonyl-ACP O-methyltransferase BioC [Lihuaxuella thermophila]SEM92690.1 malonyl-CoA O-methyltransferase [Lihuaxuella thermophila]